MATTPTADAASDLQPPVREALRDLILVLADSKRLLGTRYAEWILGAPELETGIACASMAQDEWGHGRLFYAMLKDFGEDPGPLEHDREPADYRSLEPLDREPDGWPDVVALFALADAALSAQIEALRGSAYAPLRQRVEKLLVEERFHAAHGAAWVHRLAGTEDARAALAASCRAMLPSLARWFGPDSERARALVQAGIADAAGGALRARFYERVAPLLAAVGVETTTAEPDFDGFDEGARRGHAGAPDAATIAHVRGDLNRAFLMD